MSLTTLPKELLLMITDLNMHPPQPCKKWHDWPALSRNEVVNLMKVHSKIYSAIESLVYSSEIFVDNPAKFALGLEPEDITPTYERKSTSKRKLLEGVRHIHFVSFPGYRLLEPVESLSNHHTSMPEHMKNVMQTLDIVQERWTALEEVMKDTSILTNLEGMSVTASKHDRWHADVARGTEAYTERIEDIHQIVLNTFKLSHAAHFCQHPWRYHEELMFPHPELFSGTHGKKTFTIHGKDRAVISNGDSKGMSFLPNCETRYYIKEILDWSEFYPRMHPAMLDRLGVGEEDYFEPGHPRYDENSTVNIYTNRVYPQNDYTFGNDKIGRPLPPPQPSDVCKKMVDDIFMANLGSEWAGLHQPFSYSDQPLCKGCNRSHLKVSEDEKPVE